MNPQPSDAELTAIYNEHYFLGEGTADGRTLVDQLKRASARHYLAQVHSRRARSAATAAAAGTLLEVGPGRGELLSEALKAGWSVTGVEYSPSACEEIRSVLQGTGAAASYDVRCGELTQVALPTASFDACVLSDVIEHVRDPRAFLSEIHRVLKPGGTLLVATPSLDSWSARLMRGHWMEFKDEHLLYFDRRTLRAALESAGFKKVELEPGTKVLSVRYILEHFFRFPVPILTPALKALSPLIPAAIDRRQFRIVASGIVALCER